MQDPAPETISAAFGVGGQVVVVTGAAGTIGSAIAATLSRNGARVMLSDRAGAALEALRCTLEAAGADVRSEPADLVAPGDLDRLVAATLAAYGRIDALVNCGAITGSRPWDVEAVADFDRLYHTNVRSAWLLTQSVAKSMIATGGGSIVNIASINGHRATFPCALYAGTKAALMAMTRDLAIELAPHAIRLNSISPGYIAHIDREGHWVDRYLKTPWADEAYAMVREAMRASAANGQPLARVGTPADIAWACVYLCSQAARFVTGTDLLVDGGKLQEMPDREPRCAADRTEPLRQALRAWLRALPNEAWIDLRRPPWLEAG